MNFEEMSVEMCLDIFDWFDAPEHELLNHTMLSKSDADTRIARALPHIRKRAEELVLANRDTENAYPEE